MKNQKCVICGAPASQMPPVGNFVGFDCLDCRDYSINKQVLRCLTEDGKSFHLLRTRAFLEVARIDGGVPAITRVEVVVHELFNSD